MPHCLAVHCSIPNSWPWASSMLESHTTACWPWSGHILSWLGALKFRRWSVYSESPLKNKSSSSEHLGTNRLRCRWLSQLCLPAGRLLHSAQAKLPCPGGFREFARAERVSETQGEISFEKLTFWYISKKPGANGGLRNTWKVFSKVSESCHQLQLASSRGTTEGHLGHLDTSKLAAPGNTQMIGFFFLNSSLCTFLSDSST